MSATCVICKTVTTTGTKLPVGYVCRGCEGGAVEKMRRRDQFAAAAMIGLLAQHGATKPGDEKSFAVVAWAHADSMLETESKK